MLIFRDEPLTYGGDTVASEILVLHRMPTEEQGKQIMQACEHDLWEAYVRRAYASCLLLAGESVVTVAGRLGHRNANLVMSTYAHIIPGTEDRTRRAIDAAFESALPGASADQIRWLTRGHRRPRRSGTRLASDLGG